MATIKERLAVLNLAEKLYVRPPGEWTPQCIANVSAECININITIKMMIRIHLKWWTHRI